MKLSKRITGLTGGGSDGWDIFRKARAMVAAGEDVIELTIGEHDRRTSPAILDAMYQAALGGHTGYAAIPGIDALRDAVASRVQGRTGVATDRENIVICPGGQAALFASLLAVCDAGDTALVIDPYYATYPGTVRATGASVKSIAARPENGFQPDPSDIEAAARAGARALLLNSPNNPTGVVYTRDTWEGIADVARRHDLWLISDEVYDSQIWDGAHLSPRQLPDMAERVLVVGSLSKSHAMTGSRLGWAIGPKPVISEMCNLSTHTNYGVAGFIQDAGVYALSQGPSLEGEVAAPFRRRHAAVLALLTGRGIGVVPSCATMYLMIDIRPSGLSGEGFAEALLQEARVAVMPGESFGQAAAGHVRLALTVDDARLHDAVTALADCYDRLNEAAA